MMIFGDVRFGCCVFVSLTLFLLVLLLKKIYTSVIDTSPFIIKFQPPH